MTVVRLLGGRRARFSTAALAAALVAIAAAAEAEAEAGDRVLVQIGTVLATNSSQHFDGQLAAMRPQLESLFHYSSYELMKRESRDVGWGDPVDVEIPGGRLLRVMPKSMGSDRVSLTVMLRQDSRVLMDTEFTLRPRGTMMIGGPRHRDGVLIIWIGAQPVSDEKQGEGGR